MKKNKILPETLLLIAVSLFVVALISLKIVGAITWGWTTVVSPVLLVALVIFYILRELKKYDIKNADDEKNKAAKTAGFSAEDSRQMANWHKGKHLCDKCHLFDNQLVIDASRKKEEPYLLPAKETGISFGE